MTKDKGQIKGQRTNVEISAWRRNFEYMSFRFFRRKLLSFEELKKEIFQYEE